MMHDIVYYAAMFILIVYTFIMGGAFCLSVVDDDTDAQTRLGLGFTTAFTLFVAILMGVFHG